ncbi:WD40 repeat-like protein [Neoconidiobolus thromboides FSU 785]|nr:WD40 repeat-like protein [Neoconidiobolus thromboides FSU 785]
MNYSLLDPFNIGFPDHIKSKIVFTNAVKLKFNRLGTYLAAGNNSGEVGIFSTDIFTLIKKIQIKESFITTLSFSQDNEYLAIGTKEGYISIFNLILEKEICFIELNYPIIELEIIPGKKSLVFVLTRELDPLILDIKSDVPIQTYLKAESEQILDIDSQRWCDQMFDFTSGCIDRLGKFLIVGTSKGLLAVYHFESERYVHIERNSRTTIKQVLFNKNLSEILLNCKNHIKVVKFNIELIENENIKVSFNYTTKYQNHLDAGEWQYCNFDNTGDYIVGVSDKDIDRKIHIWERSSAQLHSLLVGPGNKVYDLVWHPLAPTLASLGINGKIWFWAPTYSQKWSGFSPFFSELTQNLVFREPENAYDLPYSHKSHQRHDSTKKSSPKYKGNRLDTNEEDDIIVDVCTIDNPFSLSLNHDFKGNLNQINYDEAFELPLIPITENITSPELKDENKLNLENEEQTDLENEKHFESNNNNNNKLSTQSPASLSNENDIIKENIIKDNLLDNSEYIKKEDVLKDSNESDKVTDVMKETKTKIETETEVIVSNNNEKNQDETTYKRSLYNHYDSNERIDYNNRRSPIEDYNYRSSYYKDRYERDYYDSYYSNRQSYDYRKYNRERYNLPPRNRHRSSYYQSNRYFNGDHYSPQRDNDRYDYNDLRDNRNTSDKYNNNRDYYNQQDNYSRNDKFYYNSRYEDRNYYKDNLEDNYEFDEKENKTKQQNSPYNINNSNKQSYYDDYNYRKRSSINETHNNNEEDVNNIDYSKSSYGALSKEIYSNFKYKTRDDSYYNKKYKEYNDEEDKKEKEKQKEKEKANLNKEENIKSDEGEYSEEGIIDDNKKENHQIDEENEKNQEHINKDKKIDELDSFKKDHLVNKIEASIIVNENQDNKDIVESTNTNINTNKMEESKINLDINDTTTTTTTTIPINTSIISKFYSPNKKQVKGSGLFILKNKQNPLSNSNNLSHGIGSSNVVVQRSKAVQEAFEDGEIEEGEIEE